MRFRRLRLGFVFGLLRFGLLFTQQLQRGRFDDPLLEHVPQVLVLLVEFAYFQVSASRARPLLAQRERNRQHGSDGNDDGDGLRKKE